MLGVKSLNVVIVCHAPPFIRYSPPFISLSIMLVVVLLANVGALGAVCVAFVMTAVAAEVMLPSQLAAVTVTVMVALMSAWVKV